MCCAGGGSMLVVTLGLIGLTVWLYIIVPKGFFPDQDTGLVIGTTRAPPDTSYQAMLQLQEKVVAVLQRTRRSPASPPRSAAATAMPRSARAGMFSA